ncbi:uncharacterized protein LOC122054990 [Zingiber officinale]|uniref:uncharacterized protein LOC122054990 n=1 Tax=Zingiber officinale TaxID=94328 RepID=UPI001C4D1A29|nr:uncharacterized protein LOC122054990 [Zingiber officinale]
MYNGLDGFFMNVKEGVDEMIKFLANEPSMGFFFVQKHAHASMPYLLDVKDKVDGKIREVTLHTEDLKDSVCSVESIKEFGIPIVEEMIKDINKSLLILSTSQPKRGLIRKTNEQDAFAPGGDQHGGSSRSYFSSFFSSTRQKAAALGQPQPYTMSKDDRKKHQSLAITSPEGDLLQETVPLFEDLSVQSFELRDYDRFKNDQQVKYEEWLDVPKE